MCSFQIRYMLIIVTQLDKASITQVQGIYKQLPFKDSIDSLSLQGSFLSWYLLVHLTRSKPTVNKVLIIKGQTKLCHHSLPPSTIHHQLKYIHHHHPPLPNNSQNISTSTHNHPPAPTTSQNISTTTQRQSKYIHHHQPQSKIYPSVL